MWKSPVRLIQVGLGNWGAGWSTIVREANGIELAAVVDPEPKALERAVKELRLPAGNCYRTLREALADTPCEAVLVTTPPDTHYAIASEALRWNRHVLVEKPLSTTISDARSLVEAASRAKRVLMVSQNYRFNRAVRTVQRLVANGIVGEIISCTITCQRDTRAQWKPDDFRYLMRHPYLQDMAIHHFDLLRALTGRDVRTVYGSSWRVPDSPFRHHPAVAAIMEIDGGITAWYTGNWASHESETSWNGEWELTGEAGRILWTGSKDDRGSSRVILETWGQNSRLVPQADLTFLEREGTLQALRAAVQDHELPETDAADNIRSLAAVLGCIRSIESGEVVDITRLLEGGSLDSVCPQSSNREATER